MTKQAEIREGIATVIRVNQDKFARCINDELLEKLIYWMTDKIEHNLHSQGVVIKVNRDPADCERCPVAVVCGYVAVEPIILTTKSHGEQEA